MLIQPTELWKDEIDSRDNKKYTVLGYGSYENAQDCDKVVGFQAYSNVLHRSTTMFTNVM
jgi:hypothetical protein